MRLAKAGHGESDSSDGEDEPEEREQGRLQLEGLPKDCSEQDIRDYLKKHRDDDPEPIEVHVWYDEHYKSSTAHVIYEGEWALPVSLARELDGAVFDGMTIT